MFLRLAGPNPKIQDGGHLFDSHIAKSIALLGRLNTIGFALLQLRLLQDAHGSGSVLMGADGE